MRVVAILIVVAIVYLVLARRSPVSTAVEAMKESEAVSLSSGPRPAAAPPTAPAPTAPAASSGLRAPIDRTHAVLDQVKQRNGAGEF
jgi:hypothetical protein